MGIQALLPQLKSITRQVHVSSYKGYKVAVDSYCWLHKGACTCAKDICEEGRADKCVAFCMQRVKLLQGCGVTPVMVFDGGRLPMKAEEESERHRRRAKNLQTAREHLQAGNTNAAYDHYQKAVNISPQVAQQLIQALRQAGVEYVVAPYEADAQMAWLALQGLVDAVITEDSDLLPYGCPRVLFKMDKTGMGEEIVAADLAANRQLSFVGFTPQMFLELCILAGCDFLKALPGVGIKKAHGYIRKLKSFDKVCKSLRLGGTSVPKAFEAAFQRSIWTFHHQRVYDPATKAMVHLRPLPQQGLDSACLPPAAIGSDGTLQPEALDFLGPWLPDSLCHQIAEGTIDPSTHEPFPERLFRPLQPLALNALPVQQQQEGAAAGKGRPLPVQANGISHYFRPASAPASAPALKRLRTASGPLQPGTGSQSVPPAEAAQPAPAPHAAKRQRTGSGLLKAGTPSQDTLSDSPASSCAGAALPAPAPQSPGSSPQGLTAQPSRLLQASHQLAPAAGAAGRPALASFFCGPAQQPPSQAALQEQAQPQSQVPAWRQQNTLASLQLDAGRAAGAGRRPAAQQAPQSAPLRMGQRPLAAFAATKGMQHSVPAANMALVPARPAQRAAAGPAGVAAKAGSADPAHSRFAAFRLQPQPQQQQQQQELLRSAPEPGPHGMRKLMGANAAAVAAVQGLRRSALPSGLHASVKAAPQRPIGQTRQAAEPQSRLVAHDAGGSVLQSTPSCSSSPCCAQRMPPCSAPQQQPKSLHPPLQHQAQASAELQVPWQHDEDLAVSPAPQQQQQQRRQHSSPASRHPAAPAAVEVSGSLPGSPGLPDLPSDSLSPRLPGGSRSPDGQLQLAEPPEAGQLQPSSRGHTGSTPLSSPRPGSLFQYHCRSSSRTPAAEQPGLPCASPGVQRASHTASDRLRSASDAAEAVSPPRPHPLAWGHGQRPRPQHRRPQVDVRQLSRGPAAAPSSRCDSAAGTERPSAAVCSPPSRVPGLQRLQPRGSDAESRHFRPQGLRTSAPASSSEAVPAAVMQGLAGGADSSASFGSLAHLRGLSGVAAAAVDRAVHALPC